MGRCYCGSAGHCPWHGAITDNVSWEGCRQGTPPPKPEKEPCIYLSFLRKEEIDKKPSYVCKLHGICTLGANKVAQPACADCKDYLPISSPDLPKRFLDPLLVTDSEKAPVTAMRGILAGGAAFLVCGGPSVKSVDYHRLRERGIFSLGVNNVAGFVPVDAFVCSDPPMKFHAGIFTDPKVMKFLPIPKLGRGSQRGRLRRKLPDGSFQWMDVCAKDCPNVWGFERRSWLMPDSTFFTDKGASWGNQKVGVDKTGLRKTACTMLLGMRVLHYLGARTVFLLGADFRMKQGVGLKDNYAFAEDRDGSAINSNNEHYEIVNEWMVWLRPTFEQFGFQVFNCYQESHLEAFDYVPFADALEVCRGLTPEEPFDLDGWYIKSETTEKPK